MRFSLTAKIKKNPRVVTKQIGNKTVILDPIGGEIRTLNEVAGFIWKGVDQGKTGHEIVQKICQAFEVDFKKARKDVDAFLRKYWEDGLIRSG